MGERVDGSSSLAYCEVDESSITPYPITQQVGREGGKEGGRGGGGDMHLSVQVLSS